MVHPVGVPEGIQNARRRNLLVSMLQKAKINDDIVADVADACEIREYTVLHLASSELTVADVAENLYLTEGEEKKLKEVCELEIEKQGVKLEEGGDLPPPLDEDDEPTAEMASGVETHSATAEVSAPSPQATGQDSFISANPDDEKENEAPTILSDREENSPPEDPAAEDTVVANGDNSGDATVPSDNNFDRSLASNEADKETANAAGQFTPSPQKTASAIGEAPETAEAAALHATPLPSDARPEKQLSPGGSESQTTPKGHTKQQKQDKAPATQSAPRPKSAPHTDVTKRMKDIANIPSYARPTSSAMKKAKQEAETTPTVNMKSRPTSASVMVSPSLLRPTAASKAWSSSKHQTPKGRLSATSTSDMNGAVSSAQARGPTTPKPFNLRTGSTKKEGKVLSTEELQVQRAKAQMQALKEKRSKFAKAQSAPPKPRLQAERTPTQCRPFSLTSMQLHEKARSTWEAQTEAQKKQEEAARRFRARPVSYDKSKTYTDVVSHVAESVAREKRHTKAVEPVLHSEQRLQLHRQLEEEKRAREAEAAAQAAEERRKTDEQEVLEMKEMRRSLQFHAQPVPNFSSPFKPDLSASAPPTKATAPSFQSDKRAGRRSVGDLESDPAIGVPYADNLNYFASTLRGASPQEKKSAAKSKLKSSATKDVRVDITA
eukprot:CAMPEP_0177605244 /NCGR_PEP_ID=MMETSP0419_2-20121207/16590_1 /TAXON_ID=582737 /ORGANISM="Tetraselmis sp., Strain GSL018" /LENGTH=664 /DNA_ID=CAMNT_0019099365 /DNA_START=181 /DNA_END=2179 /DNA_ORIENTATION=-